VSYCPGCRHHLNMICGKCLRAQFAATSQADRSRAEGFAAGVEAVAVAVECCDLDLDSRAALAAAIRRLKP